MNMREIMDLLRKDEEDCEPTNRHRALRKEIGRKTQEHLAIINLTIIDEEVLGDIILDLVDKAYRQRGMARPEFLASMYHPDADEEELDLAKTAAEIEKIKAQTQKLSRSSSEE